MKKFLLLFLPVICFGQNFHSFQTTQGTTITYKANQLFESFPNSLGSNPVQNTVPTGFFAWFEPQTNVTLNSTTVSQWCDLTGTYCLAQGTAGNQPTYTSGVRPYMSFNGSSTFLSLSSFGGIGTNSKLSVFFVVSFTSTSGTQAPITYEQTGAHAAAGTYECYLSSAFLHAYANMTSGTDLTVFSVTAAATYLAGIELNRTSGNSYGFYSSNYQSTSGSITTTLTDWSSGTFYLGKDLAGDFLNAKIYDVIFYNRELSAAEYSSLYSFFKAKYNLQ